MLPLSNPRHAYIRENLREASVKVRVAQESSCKSSNPVNPDSDSGQIFYTPCSTKI